MDTAQSQPDISYDESLDIAVIRFPHIANFDDFDPLLREPKVRLRFISKRDDLGVPDLIVLPRLQNDRC